MNLVFRGESPGLTNDYRSHGEKILGRVSLATWKERSGNMGLFSPGAYGGQRAGGWMSLLGAAWRASRIVYTDRSGVPRIGFSEI